MMVVIGLTLIVVLSIPTSFAGVPDPIVACADGLTAGTPDFFWRGGAEGGGGAEHQLSFTLPGADDRPVEFDLALYWGRRPDAATFSSARVPAAIEVEHAYRTALGHVLARYPRLRNITFDLSRSNEWTDLAPAPTRAQVEGTAIARVLTELRFVITAVERTTDGALLHAVRR